MTWLRKADKVNTLVGVRYWIESNNTKYIARLLTWVTNNLNYVVVTFPEETDNCPHGLQKAVKESCLDPKWSLTGFHCIQRVIARYNTIEFCAKRVYGVGHGIFLWLFIRLYQPFEERDRYPQKAFTIRGRIFFVVDTYKGLNEKQKELMKLIDDNPELVRPM